MSNADDGYHVVSTAFFDQVERLPASTSFSGSKAFVGTHVGSMMSFVHFAGGPRTLSWSLRSCDARSLGGGPASVFGPEKSNPGGDSGGGVSSVTSLTRAAGKVTVFPPSIVTR